MLRTIAIAGLLPLVLLASPASAATTQEKMETCKVGAESQELTGAKRDAFIKRCMAKGNYEPAARKDAMRSATKKKQTPKPAAPAATESSAPKPGDYPK